MENSDSSTSKQKVDTLISEVFRLNDIPTADKAKEENKANGIDTNDLQQWALQQLNQVQAKVKVEKIKQLRLAKEKELEGISPQAVEGIETLKYWLSEKLNELSPNVRAQVYCRDFESALHEDLLQMKEDILFLEGSSDENAIDEV